ncbi:hypothetical protein EG68_08824 [Paragonimus skrjabini miyazakii]|uniref:C-type lectin domain-containing protein n=1 Tax=Paragonimus skrjabini miyazakii TaxID=59628 RepID=A0A8S9YA94_9TREM|nr:hypothetical protein EG68_08824 [Paragonimus skrjabini miyazakii]
MRWAGFQCLGLLFVWCASWLPYQCDPGSNPESCFDIVKSNLTFLDANVECTKRGKFLLTIYSKKQLKTVSARLKKEIGTSVDVWFGLYITFDRYQWISGSPVVVNTFLTPVPAPNNAHCFSMRGGDSLDTWTPRYCNVKLWFLCGAKPHVLPKSPSPSFPKNLGCPNNYKLFGTRCYLSKLELVDALTWDDAANFCSKLTANGSLATISSFAEQDYLSIMVARSSGPVWIGRLPTGGEQRRCSVIHQRPRDLGEWENVNCSAKLGFVCQAAALVVPQPTNTGLSLLSNRGRCLPEFFEYNRRCYRLLTQLSDAGIKNNLDGTNCQTRIAPHSPEELVLMRLMMRTASSLPEFSWIGVNFSYNSTLSPTKSKIQFSVEDGLPVTLGAALNFYDDQLMQTLKGHENSANYCVAIGRDVAGLSLMNCSTQLPSICGYSMHDYELQPTTTSTSCPSTWKRLGDVCYSDFRYPPRTWSDAESNCQSLDPKAHLVSLHTPTQQSYLSRLLQHRRAWLGLRVQLQTNANRTRIYTWSDESPVDYLSFGVGEPSFGLSNGDVEECVVLQDETHDWNDVHCYDRYPFVCQLTLSPSVDQTSVSTTLIPQDPLQQFCFKDDSSFCVELHQTPLTFWDAETMCQSRNLTLVTVPSKGHHKFVMTFLPEHESAFIGLFASNGQWLWTSAYPSLSATFWSKNHPFGKDLCVFVEKSEDELYTWKAGPCDQPMPYFCATRPTLPVLKSVDLTKYTCPSNYTRIGPSCYLVKAGLEDKATWTEALNLCALTASGAGLATISSIQEQNELIALLGLQFKSAWIGLQLVDDVHTWQRGDPVIYTNWARDQPSGHGMVSPRLISTGRLVTTVVIVLIMHLVVGWLQSRCFDSLLLNLYSFSMVLSPRQW